MSSVAKFLKGSNSRLSKNPAEHQMLLCMCVLRMVEDNSDHDDAGIICTIVEILMDLATAQLMNGLANVELTLAAIDALTACLKKADSLLTELSTKVECMIAPPEFTALYKYKFSFHSQ